MVTKTYTVPLYRKISEGHLKPSDIKSSDLFLEVTGERIGTSNENSPKSEIYSIDKTRRSIIVYSNTLGFKITDIFHTDNTPLYNMIVIPSVNSTKLLSELSAQVGTKFKTELLTESIIVFFNYNKNLITLDGIDYRVDLIYPVAAPFLKHPDVKTKRLKDRLKVTITSVDPSTAVVELISTDLLKPKVHNENWIEFYECVIKDRSGKYIHIYNHSFENLNKIEFQKYVGNIDYKVKDPILNISHTIVGEYLRYQYDSYRSNLLINTELNSDLYFYLNYAYENKTDLISVKFKEEVSEDLLEVYRLKDTERKLDVLVNPYIENKLYSLCGENFTLMLEDNIKRKYNKPDDIRFGNTRVILDLYNMINKPVDYLRVGDNTIIQVDLNPVEATPEVNELPPELLKYSSKLDVLRTKINTNLELHPALGNDERKYYSNQ